MLTLFHSHGILLNVADALLKKSSQRRKNKIKKTFDIMMRKCYIDKVASLRSES
ncbi:hypothetical protein BATR1942_01955 [Bacillus atrophaeus 1942]|uniref:Transposase n=1 Tax=Bacillus atrophaeus (strain 1942) TaxID=720555 RepID=A0ABN3Z881_BACA1|nr:hypothetical protein BATR1942_01955 [Bacillus atrophaeus 1942]AKL83403.1 hypothetical protein D068_cds08660 [Bacillus atrophaeus UCMB-5137]EIM09146.1 hypothetical protein UY9_19234 [Bacillus atrophaeus C89]